MQKGRDQGNNTGISRPETQIRPVLLTPHTTDQSQKLSYDSKRQDNTAKSKPSLTGATSTTVLERIVRQNGLKIDQISDAHLINASGDAMLITGTTMIASYNGVKKPLSALVGMTTMIASYNDVKKPLRALVVKRQTHDMISRRDCIRFNIIPKIFPEPPSAGNINSTQTEAEDQTSSV